MTSPQWPNIPPQQYSHFAAERRKKLRNLLLLIVGVALLICCIGVAVIGNSDTDGESVDKVRPLVVQTTNSSTLKPTPTVSKTTKVKKSKKPKPKKTTEEPVFESYDNCTEMRKVYPNGVRSDHPAYESGMDRDDDGRACERN